MSDHGWTQVQWAIAQLFALLRIVIWPAFLWSFTKRPDIREHIRLLLNREWRIKVPGADVRVTSAERPKRLPTEEAEKELVDVPKPQRWSGG